MVGLFAKCVVNKAKIVALNRQRVLAAATGDEVSAQDAVDKLRALEPSWNDTLDKIGAASTAVTGDEGPEFQKLILRVQQECST